MHVQLAVRCMYVPLYIEMISDAVLVFFEVLYSLNFLCRMLEKLSNRFLLNKLLTVR